MLLLPLLLILILLLLALLLLLLSLLSLLLFLSFFCYYCFFFCYMNLFDQKGILLLGFKPWDVASQKSKSALETVTRKHLFGCRGGKGLAFRSCWTWDVWDRLGMTPKESLLPYSTQFIFLIIRLLHGNVVMVAIDMCGAPSQGSGYMELCENMY